MVLPAFSYSFSWGDTEHLCQQRQLLRGLRQTCHLSTADQLIPDVSEYAFKQWGKWKINALTLHQTNLNYILGEKTHTVQRQVQNWGEVLYIQSAKNCKTEAPTVKASNLWGSPCWKDWKSKGNWLNTVVLIYPKKESTTRANQYFIIFLFFPAHLTVEKSSTRWAHFYFIDFIQDSQIHRPTTYQRILQCALFKHQHKMPL